MSRKRNNTKKEPAFIDVCIVEAGRFDMLADCLDALYREAQTVPLSIYILTNGVSSGELLDNQHLLTYQPDKDPAHGVKNFEVKKSPQNLGFPVGSNTCAKMGNSPLILFLGDDVVLQPGAIEKVVRRFDEQNIGIVGMKLLFPETSTNAQRPAGKVQHVGLGMSVRGVPIHPLIGWSADNPKTCKSKDVWAVTGAAFTIRRSIFSMVKGFDPIFGLGTFEDLDLCMKARQMGKRVFLEAEATGYHYVGATAEKLNTPFPLQQNGNMFMSRWQNSGQVFWNEYEWW